MQQLHDWLDTTLLGAILYVTLLSRKHLAWLHDVFTPFLASVPKLIKNGGKDIG